MQERQISNVSLLATGAMQRLLGAAILVAGLWLAVAWAVH